ncbi:uncharacterized protein LOC101238613 [Trichonephila clavipes]|nr:uncharacterized protein LOC101238613 [Trichonephila clavipes]
MEVVGAYRIFERSNVRNVQYNEYYGDGDSKGYESVKNFYGINTVTKLECIAVDKWSGKPFSTQSFRRGQEFGVPGRNNSFPSEIFPVGQWQRYQKVHILASCLFGQLICSIIAQIFAMATNIRKVDVTANCLSHIFMDRLRYPKTCSKASTVALEQEQILPVCKRARGLDCRWLKRVIWLEVSHFQPTMLMAGFP